RVKRVGRAVLACRLHPRLRTYRCEATNRRFGPRLCEKSHGCYDSFFESAGGSDGCQALWKGLTEANAQFSLPCLTTTWPRTIRFVRLTRSLKVLILISLALVGLSRWKKGGPATMRRHCSRYIFMAISIAFRRADGLSVNASVISSWSGSPANWRRTSRPLRISA